jgi:hypothetical protein
MADGLDHHGGDLTWTPTYVPDDELDVHPHLLHVAACHCGNWSAEVSCADVCE